VILIYVLFACLLGVGAGVLYCLGSRRRWNYNTGIVDALWGAIVFFVAWYLESEIYIARGLWDAPVGLAFGIAMVSVVLKHLFFLWRSFRVG